MKLHNPLWKDFRNKDVVRLPAGSRVRIAGWAHAIRDLGGIVFLLVRDSDGLVQVVASKSELDEKTFNAFKGVKPETVLSIEGVVKQSPKAPRGVEIKALSLSILNEANVPSHLEPSSRGRISLDERLDNRTLDLRKPRNMAIFKFQSSLVKHIREYLHLHGFVEVFTPRLIATATEGGAALFPIAYFDKEAFLAQSPQLYKEQLSSVFERVYEIGPLFRAEESQTDRHVSEYVGIDVEVAFSTHKEVMDLLEDLIVDSVSKTIDELHEFLEEADLRCLEIRKPFPRITYDEVLLIMDRKGIKISWGEDLSTEAGRKLGEELNGPYFITEWPTRIKPFYIMPKPDNVEVSLSFDLMIGRIEIASGGQRIHDKDLLASRMKGMGLEPESFKHHLKCFEWGMPPHSGWGLGLARLTMALLGLNDIRETILYPRDRWRLIP